MKKWIFNSVGVLLAFVGLFWFLEGTGVLYNSLITEDSPWTFIGLIMLFIGSGLLLYINSQLMQRE
jgi:hypothetical protein